MFKVNQNIQNKKERLQKHNHASWLRSSNRVLLFKCIEQTDSSRNLFKNKDRQALIKNILRRG